MAQQQKLTQSVNAVPPRDPTVLKNAREKDSDKPTSSRSSVASIVPQPRKVFVSDVPIHHGPTIVEVIPQLPVTICPYCGYAVSPVLSYEPSPLAYLWCLLVTILLMPFFCIGLFIGLMILASGACQSPRYVCPLCGTNLSGPIMM